MKIRFNLFFVAVIATALLFASGCSQNADQSEHTAVKAVEVKTAFPSHDAGSGITASGEVRSSLTADISTRMMGYITSVKVKAGDHVSKGQLLATISSEDITAKRAQAEAMIGAAEAAYKNAAKDLQRFKALYNEQSASAKELDNVSLQFASAAAQLKAAKQMKKEADAALAYTNLRAPFSGVVTRKFADAGNMASPGMPLLTVEQPGKAEIAGSIAESDVDKVRPGMPVQVSINTAGKRFSGTIREISPSSASTGGQFLIKVSVPGEDNKGLYSGMYATLFIPISSSSPAAPGANSILVPTGSIVRKDQLTGIYTLSSSGQAVLRWVRLGKTFGGNTEVLSGLDKNEKFIAEASGRLYDGAPVKEMK